MPYADLQSELDRTQTQSTLPDPGKNGDIYLGSTSTETISDVQASQYESLLVTSKQEKQSHLDEDVQSEMNLEHVSRAQYGDCYLASKHEQRPDSQASLPNVESLPLVSTRDALLKLQARIDEVRSEVGKASLRAACLIENQERRLRQLTQELERSREMRLALSGETSLSSNIDRSVYRHQELTIATDGDELDKYLRRSSTEEEFLKYLLPRGH